MNAQEIFENWDGTSNTENTLYEITETILKEEIEAVGGEHNEYSLSHSERGLATFHPDRESLSDAVLRIRKYVESL